jgi:hypothetical protein
MALLRYLTWRRGIAGRSAVGILDAGRGFALSEPEAFQTGVHRAHMEGREKSEEKTKSDGGRGWEDKERSDWGGG